MNKELSITISARGSEKTASQLKQVAEAAKSIDPALKGAAGGSNSPLSRLTADAARATSATESLGNKLAGVGKIAAGLLIAPQLLSGIQSAGRAMFEASASSERLRTQLSFSTGNAGREMGYLADLTGRLGLEFKSTAQAYAGFAAASRGTALEGQKARDVFEAISKASAVMGLSADQSSGALLAIQQMMSKGVVSAEEFRGQLGERMPIALQAGAKALNVTTAEFSHLMETGKIVAEDFLPKFAQAITEMLGDAPEKAAARLDAATNRMGNSWERLKQSVGDAGVSKAIASDMDTLTKTADAMSEAMEQSGKKGAGGLVQLANAAGVLIGRSALGGLASVAETVNATLNTLSGGALQLSTNISLLPNNLRPAADALNTVEGKLKSAQVEYDELAKRVERTPDNIYIRGQLGDLGVYIAKLKEARSELSALTGAGNYYGNEGRGSTQQREADAAALAAARKRAAAYGETIKKYATPEEKKAAALREAKESLGEFFTKDIENRISDSFAKGGGRGGGSARSDDGARMLESLREKIALGEVELASTEKLTAAERERAKVKQALASGALKASAAQQAAILGLLDEAVAQEKSIAAQEEFRSGVERLEQANLKQRQAMVEQIAVLEQSAKTYGMTESAISSMVAAELEEAIAIARLNGARQESIDVLEDELDRRNKLTKAIEDNELARLLGNTETAKTKKTEADIATLDRWLAGDPEGRKKQYDEAIAGIKGGVGEIDEFTRQAARNMQDAFANFLFDPFSKGVKDMARSFADTVRKMAAEALSAQLMNKLFGTMGKDGNVGGIIGSLFGGKSAGTGKASGTGEIYGPPAENDMVSAVAGAGAGLASGDNSGIGDAIKGIEADLGGLFNSLKRLIEGLLKQISSVISSLGSWLSKIDWGSLFSSAGGSSTNWGGVVSGVASLFADGGIMTSAGPIPLRKYAGGGIASSPQIALFGEGSTPEAYVPLPDGRHIPVAMQGGGQPAPPQNIRIVNAFDTSVVGDYLGSAAGERVIMNAVQRNARAMRQALA